MKYIKLAKGIRKEDGYFSKYQENFWTRNGICCQEGVISTGRQLNMNIKHSFLLYNQVILTIQIPEDGPADLT